jgi:hypothetical protein
MTRRINARLDAELTRKIEALRKLTGRSTTDIVKASLESYYVATTQRASPAAALAPFVGCAEGPRDLSEEYKSELTKSWSKKTGR